LNSLRPLLLILAWLLALLPADAPALIPRRENLPPVLPVLRTAPVAEDDGGTLTLHLDGLHDRAGPCRRVLVRQNPWTMFDPEGLYTAAEWKDIGKANIVNTGIMLKGMVWDFPKDTLQSISTVFWHPIASAKAMGNSVKRETVTLFTDPKLQMQNYGSTLQHMVLDPKELGKNGANILLAGGLMKAAPTGAIADVSVGEVASARTVVADATPRARHYTSPETLAKIKASEEILPARGGGVHVETGPPFGPAATGSAETGAHASGAYVEFNATAPMKSTTAGVGGRKTAVIPTKDPLPIGNLKPTYKTTPWWKFW